MNADRDLAGLIVAASFAAGLNVYATIATLGLLGHSGIVPLPPALDIVSSWWVIAICAVLFVVEFFADKIPAFDLVWNLLQTFVRVPVGALLAYGAASHLTPPLQIGATTAGAIIAFLAHGAKTAARAAVTPSPEPFSNIALSLGEDALAISLTWFATRHPLLAAAIVILLLAAIVLSVRWIVRAIRRLIRRERFRTVDRSREYRHDP
jgi:hypothetical protein